jgi:hypothetical protein
MPWIEAVHTLRSIVRASFFMGFLRSWPVRDVFGAKEAPESSEAARVSRGGFV